MSDNMNVADIENALISLKEESEDFKSSVLYQQLREQLEKVTWRSSVTSVADETLLSVPGFSKYTINEIRLHINEKQEASKMASVSNRLKPIPSLRRGQMICKTCDQSTSITPGSNRWRCKNCGIIECLACKKVVTEGHFYGQGGQPGPVRTCPCWYEFEDEEMNEEMDEEINEEEFVCKKCNQSCQNRSLLTIHLSLIHI